LGVETSSSVDTLSHVGPMVAVANGAVHADHAGCKTVKTTPKKCTEMRDCNASERPRAASSRCRPHQSPGLRRPSTGVSAGTGLVLAGQGSDSVCCPMVGRVQRHPPQEKAGSPRGVASTEVPRIRGMSRLRSWTPSLE
jgi:hypothetical protein